MTLPASGPISLSDVNVELGLGGTAQISMNSAAVRGLFGVASGQIKMSDGYGKSNVFAFAFDADQSGVDLRAVAVSRGWNETSAVEATVNSGVVISGDGTNATAMTVSGSFAGGVTLINNGFIVGRGGTGGTGGALTSTSGSGSGTAGLSGGGGGTGLSVSAAITVENNGTIAGGGGGGGGGGPRSFQAPDGTDYLSGSGGSGGRSGRVNSAGGPHGSAPSSIFFGGDGAAGTFASAGAAVGNGGAGGDWGAAGQAGSAGNLAGGGAGGTAGKSIVGNANITYTATGTRIGAVT